jgi:hypothetical protein
MGSTQRVCQGSRLCRLDNKPDRLRGTRRFLKYYNLRRRHQGYRLTGRTPAQALQERSASPSCSPW